MWQLLDENISNNTSFLLIARLVLAENLDLSQPWYPTIILFF